MYQNLNYLILVSKTGWLKIILCYKKKKLYNTLFVKKSWALKKISGLSKNSCKLANTLQDNI